MADTFPDILRHADIANEAVGAMGRVAPEVLPGPIVYDVLAELKGLSHRLPEAFDKIASAMGKALKEFDMREDDGGDSEERSALSREHILKAAELARQMAAQLEAAQSAIAHQKFRP
jgi:hypothetical protein